jgi:hypothetical protein
MSLSGKLKERTRGGARTLFGTGIVDQRLARALLSGRPAVARHGAVLTSGKSSKRETGVDLPGTKPRVEFVYRIAVADPNQRRPQDSLFDLSPDKT